MLRLLQIFGTIFSVYLLIQIGIGIFVRREDTAVSWIAFLSNRDMDGNGDIYRMWPDGSRVQRMTHTYHTECNIQWSKDGRSLQVVYVEPQFANYPYCNKVHFEYARLDYRRRVPMSIPIGISELSLSPDGRYIAYADATSHLYRIHTDDHSTVQLTDSGNVDYFPVWSPDGRWIAFQSLRGRGYVEFYRMDAVTGEILQLTDYLFGFVNGIAPSWSPDSQWLTFWVEDRLFKVSSNGGTPTLLMNAVGSVRTPPVWSPDGQSIAFIASSIADTLYVVPSGGGQPETLTHRRIDSRSMSWSPDSEWLVYQTLRGEDIELYKIRRDGTDMQQLTDVSDAVSLNPIWSPAIVLEWRSLPLVFIALVAMLAPTTLVIIGRLHHQFAMKSPLQTSLANTF